MKYFTISEMVRSNKAKSLKIDNNPPPFVVDNLVLLIDECMDKIREMWHAPIIVSSGYRCPELNDVVGGDKNSNHLKGYSCDFKAKNIEDNGKLFKMIVDSDIPFTKVIWEYGNEEYPSWIHIDYIKNKPARKVVYIR